MTTRIALCPHLSIEHYRGGEKLITKLANYLVTETEDIAVEVRALPYAPNSDRRVNAATVLHDDVQYQEAWRHDLTGVDTAYVMYTPGIKYCYPGADRYIAGIHSWAFVSENLYEPHYGIVPTLAKILYKLAGKRDLAQFDAVHSVTPAFTSPHLQTIFIPNFVDQTLYHPDRAPLRDTFTVLVTAAHIPEKGWDFVKTVADNLPSDIELYATGNSDIDTVHDLGFLSESELAEAYARSHVVLHPARVDTDSMVINEACASGTPVVTTPLPTHIRRNSGVIHAATPTEMRKRIIALQQEWVTDTGYATRCRIAKQSVETRDSTTVFPALERLLREPDTPAVAESFGTWDWSTPDDRSPYVPLVNSATLDPDDSAQVDHTLDPINE